MLPSNKFLTLLVAILALFCVLASVNLAFSEEPLDPVLTAGMTRVQSVRIGAHPDYTRVLIDLNQQTTYKIKADFVKKKVTLTLSNSVLTPDARSVAFKDSNVEKVEMSKGEGSTVAIDLFLRNPNSRFFHVLKTNPDQIIIDIKGDAKPFIKTKIKKLDIGKDGGLADGSAGELGVLKIPGRTQADVKEAVVKDAEEKLKGGWDDYVEALKMFQQQKYLEALYKFYEFQKKYKQSRFLESIAYLAGEGEFRIAFRDKHPNYERALGAYKYALREFPDSRFREHALVKAGFIYDEMNLLMEARSVYEHLLKENPKILYGAYLKTRLALLLIKQNHYEDAYANLISLLKDNPKDNEAREGVFKIAKWYYDQSRFAEALKVYEDAAVRWPRQLTEDPDINFYIAEMYYKNKDYANARKYYFELINLAPDSQQAYKAISRVGDTYFTEGNDFASLTVFDEAAKRKEGGREIQYAKIRLADIGVRNPNLPIKDIVFDVGPYFEPFKTYDKILNEAVDKEIMAETFLSKGIAYLRGQRFLDAMEQFKFLLAMKPEKRLAQEGTKFLTQTLILLVDKYSSQEGHLPILYAYGDYLGMSLGDIDNVKTILQVGESYQAIGMYQEAAQHYEKVKRLDTRKTYSDRIFLNLGKISLEDKKFKDADSVARIFLNKYPHSNMTTDALKLQAGALAGQERFEDAIAVYKDMLERGLGTQAETHYRMGQLYSKMNKLAEAVDAYQQTIDTFDRGAKVRPDYVASAYYQQGIALYNNKEFPKAVESLDRARQIYPEHPIREWADLLIAQSYNQMQNPGQAVAEFTGLKNSGAADDLVKQAADSRLKMLEWEKQFKDLL